MSGKRKINNDLWNEFIEEDPSDDSPPKAVTKDGTEWTGQYDRRKSPRNDGSGNSDASEDPASEKTNDSDEN